MCLRPDRERHPQLPACDEPENGAYHREAECREPDGVTHVVYEAERQDDQIEQEHDGINRSLHNGGGQDQTPMPPCWDPVDAAWQTGHCRGN